MGKDKRTKIAKIISTLFLPPFMTFSIFFLFTTVLEVSSSEQIKFIVFVFLITVAIPISLFIFLRKKNKVTDDEARIKEQRDIPYLIAMVILLAGFIISIDLDVAFISKALFFTYIITSFFILLVNIFWKISAHLLSIGGPAGAASTAYLVTGQFEFLAAAVIYCAGAAALFWARLVLDCHSKPQMITGFIAGFIINGAFLFLILDFYGRV